MSALFCKSGNNIKIKRFAQSAGLFGSVKHCDLLNGGRNSRNQLVCFEGTVKTYLYKTYLFALCG